MITCRTVVKKDRVEYSVERGDEVLWSRSVRFGHRVANQAGGYHFQAAAREQEQQAARAMEPDERVEEVTYNERA